MSKVILKDGVLTEVETTMIDTALTVVTSPLSLISKDTTKEYYSKKTLGFGILAAAVAGIFVGDKYGAKIPLIGGRRGVSI